MGVYGILDLTFQYKMRNTSVLQFGIQLSDGAKRKKEYARGLQCSHMKFDKIKNMVEWSIFWCFNGKKMVKMIGFMNLATKPEKLPKMVIFITGFHDINLYLMDVGVSQCLTCVSF